LHGLRGVLTVVITGLLCVPAGHAVADEPDAESEAMIEAINEARDEHGLGPLRHAPALSRSSATFADDLMGAGVFGHGSGIRAAGGFSRLGEVLAMHRGRKLHARRTVRYWLGSPAHRPLLLTRSMRNAGAGAAGGSFRGRPSTIWVVQFGAR
jgi:uncharacterized protein YkwD